MKHTFTATARLLDHWLTVPAPVELSEPLKPFAANFGFIPITVRTGGTSWSTSLMPLGDGAHFIALPAKVRKKEKLTPGTEVSISFELRTE